MDLSPCGRPESAVSRSFLRLAKLPHNQIISGGGSEGVSSLFLDVHSSDVVIRFRFVIMEPGIKRTTVHMRRGSMRGTGINERSIIRLLGATQSTSNRALGWSLGDLVSRFWDGCFGILLSCFFRNVTLTALIIGQGRSRPDAPL